MSAEASGARADLSRPDPAGGDPGGRDPGRDDVIRDAALAVLAEVGYDCMSMDAVAHRAHASKATIYRWWTGKEELVLDALRCRAVPEHAAPPDTGSLRGDIMATLRAMAQGIGGEDADLVAGILRAMRATPEIGACVRGQVVDSKRRVARALVERAVARGELAADADPEVLHEVAPSLMFFRVLVVGEPVDDAYLTHVTDDVLVPLLTGSGHPRPEQETP